MNLETVSVSELRKHIAPLIVPGKEDELARRFELSDAPALNFPGCRIKMQIKISVLPCLPRNSSPGCTAYRR